MQISIFVVFILLSGWLIQDDKKVCFQSDELKNIQLFERNGSFEIRDDTGHPVEVVSLEDNNGILYWYRRLETPVCLTGECKLIDIGIYWYFNGDFLGLEVYDEPLTKTDHSVFGDQDYQKLLSILENDWSILREYDREGLLNEDYEEIDGSSGATKKEIAEESVTGAVYTTYTIWHLIYVGENEQIALLTLDQLNNPERLKKFVESDNKKVNEFLLDQMAAGYISIVNELSPFIIESLQSTDLYTQNLAFKSLKHLELNNDNLQADLAGVYNNAQISAKRRLISALSEVEIIDSSLFNALESDLSIENRKMAIEILKILNNSELTGKKAIAFSFQILNGENEEGRKVATNYLEKHNSLGN